MKISLYFLATTFTFCTLDAAAQTPAQISGMNQQYQQQRELGTTHTSGTYRGSSKPSRRMKKEAKARRRHQEIHGTNLPGGYRIEPNGDWVDPTGKVVAHENDPEADKRRAKYAEEKARQEAKFAKKRARKAK